MSAIQENWQMEEKTKNEKKDTTKYNTTNYNNEKLIS